MRVVISARHGHLSETHRQEIQDKAEKLLHFFDRITLIEVTIDFQHDLVNGVEVRATAEHKHEFIAKDSEKELFVSLGHAIEKVKHQIKHYKEKIQDHRRDPSHGGATGAL